MNGEEVALRSTNIQKKFNKLGNSYQKDFTSEEALLNLLMKKESEGKIDENIYFLLFLLRKFSLSVIQKFKSNDDIH